MICGWKRNEAVQGLFRCNMNDPDCIQWSVTGKGSVSWQTIDFDSFQKAKQVDSALERAFNAGRRQRMRELQNFLEGSDIPPTT